MHELERFLTDSLPFGDAASFFLSMTKRAAATDPPDESGVLEGQFAIPVEQVLALMGELVRNEFETIYAYEVYSQTLRDLSHDSIAGHFQEHADEEHDHAEFLLRRMAVLGGPVHVPDLKAPPASAEPVQIIQTMIRMEQEGIAGWRKLLAVVGENPMKVTIEDYMAAEQQHLDDLWQLLPHTERPLLGPAPAGGLAAKTAGKLGDAATIAAFAALPPAVAVGTALAMIGPGGRKRINSEIHDPRLYSNLRGMATLESQNERVSAHKHLDRDRDHSVLSAMSEGFSRRGKQAADDPQTAGRRRAQTNMAAQVEADALSRGEDIGDIAGRGIGALAGGYAGRGHGVPATIGGVAVGQHMGGLLGKAVGRAVDDARYKNALMDEQLTGEPKQADDALLGRLAAEPDPQAAYKDYLASKGFRGGAIGAMTGTTGGALAGSALGSLLASRMRSPEAAGLPAALGAVGGLAGGAIGGYAGRDVGRNNAFKEIARTPMAPQDYPVGPYDAPEVPKQAATNSPDEVAGFPLDAKAPTMPVNGVMAALAKKVPHPVDKPTGAQQGMGTGQTFEVKRASLGSMLKRAFGELDNPAAGGAPQNGVPQITQPGVQHDDPPAVMQPPQAPAFAPQVSPEAQQHMGLIEYLKGQMAEDVQASKAEADYYREQAGQASEQIQSQEQQIQQTTEQVQQLSQQAQQAQQQLEQTLQQSQSVQQQAIGSAVQANQLATQAQLDHLKAMQEAMLHKTLSANMRADVIQMKQQVGDATQQIQQTLANDPTEGIEQQLQAPAASMGPTEQMPGDQAVPAQQPAGTPTAEGQDPAQAAPAEEPKATEPAAESKSQGESQPNTKIEIKQASAKETIKDIGRGVLNDAKKHGPYALPGAILGAGYVGLGHGGFADPLAEKLRAAEEQRAGRDATFAEAGNEGQLKVRHMVAELADRYPKQMALAAAAKGAGLGIMAGHGVRNTQEALKPFLALRKGAA